MRVAIGWQQSPAAFALAFLATILCARAEPQYTILKSFGFADQTGTNLERDGVSPNYLFEASDGVLYGTTESGGSSDGGTVFGINKDGSNYSVLGSSQVPRPSHTGWWKPAMGSCMVLPAEAEASLEARFSDWIPPEPSLRSCSVLTAPMDRPHKR